MPDTELAVLTPSSMISFAAVPREQQVLEAIMSIKSSLVKRALELGRLLREASENDYHHQWGYARFGDWVEESSGLDMSARSAYDLIKLIEQSERLAIPDEQLERVKISKLTAIFTLKDGEMTDDEIREMVKDAEIATLKDIRERISIAKQQEWVNRNYKFDKSAYENVIVPTIERIKREYGTTMGDDGGEADISDSKAIEIGLADYSAGPEHEEEYAIDAEFEDVFMPEEPTFEAEAT